MLNKRIFAIATACLVAPALSVYASGTQTATQPTKKVAKATQTAKRAYKPAQKAASIETVKAVNFHGKVNVGWRELEKAPDNFANANTSTALATGVRSDESQFGYSFESEISGSRSLYQDMSIDAYVKLGANSLDKTDFAGNYFEGNSRGFSNSASASVASASAGGLKLNGAGLSLSQGFGDVNLKASYGFEGRTNNPNAFLFDELGYQRVDLQKRTAAGGSVTSMMFDYTGRVNDSAHRQLGLEASGSHNNFGWGVDFAKAQGNNKGLAHGKDWSNMGAHASYNAGFASFEFNYSKSGDMNDPRGWLNAVQSDGATQATTIDNADHLLKDYSVKTVGVKISAAPVDALTLGLEYYKSDVSDDNTDVTSGTPAVTTAATTTLVAANLSVASFYQDKETKTLKFSGGYVFDNMGFELSWTEEEDTGYAATATEVKADKLEFTAKIGELTAKYSRVDGDISNPAYDDLFAAAAGGVHRDQFKVAVANTDYATSNATTAFETQSLTFSWDF